MDRERRGGKGEARELVKGEREKEREGERKKERERQREGYIYIFRS